MKTPTSVTQELETPLKLHLQSHDSVTTNNFSKKRETSMYFHTDRFYDFKGFFNDLSNKCIPNTRYSILTRVLFVDKDVQASTTFSEWKTLGQQIGIMYDNNFETKVYDYYKVVLERLSLYEELYEFKDLTLQGFQILLYKVQYTDIISPKKLEVSSLGQNKDLIIVSKVKNTFNSLPLTTNKSSFGKLLEMETFKDKIISVTLLDGDKINFTDLVNKHLSDNDKMSSYSTNTNFYQNPSNSHITTVTTLHVDSKDTNNNLSNDVFDNPESIVNYISIYNDDGLKIHSMTDKQIDYNRFSRKVGNIEVFIDNNGIYNRVVELIFNYVRPSKIVGYFSKLIFSDNRIGSLDLETYKNQFNISKTYAIGFCVGGNTSMYYIKEDFDSHNLIMECLENMLVEKYNGFTFYVHNLGGFDSVFLLKVMVDVASSQPNIYEVNLIVRDDKILSIRFSKKIGSKKYSIKLVDSYNFLSSKLSKLCKTFNSTVNKGVFPYNFVKHNTIFYLGKKPNKNLFNYYDHIKDIDKDDNLDDDTIESMGSNLYNEIPNDNWSTKEETLKYLEKDLIGLFEIMDAFKKRIYQKYHTHVTRCLTISGLAMDLFLRRFYGNNIPLINKKSIYEDIKKSYFGGITEVYKPQGRNLYYYDVNSLYPYSALNTMPGLNCKFIDNININMSNISFNKEDMFGFYFCSINASDNYIGLLPFRTKSGVIMPVGKYEGWYFSEELKFAHDNGYNIYIHKGYDFERENGVFNKYVNEFFKLKLEAKDGVERSIAKSLLNNLLGRFGLKIDKSITELVNEDKYNEISQSREVKGFKQIGDTKLVTYSSNISQKICQDHDVDFDKIHTHDINNNKSRLSEERLHDVSIAIASAVTSYSRIFMNKMKLNILKKGNIYYMDTDSIVTDVVLDDNYVNNNIGMFKLEHTIKEAYFISNKTYSFINSNDKTITRTKGIYHKSLKFDDFKKLFAGLEVKGFRNESIKSYSEGYVNINEVPITISPNSYTKREKIFKNNLWVDTKPLVLQ